MEKPSTVDCSELLQIIYTCGKHNVVFMDGVMFMHHKRMQYLFKHLNDPFCGDVQKIVSAFSFNGTNSDFFATDIRTKVDGDLLGAMGDLGWYCIRLALLVFNKGNDMLLRQKGFMWPKECKSVRIMIINFYDTSFNNITIIYNNIIIIMTIIILLTIGM